MGLYSQHSFTVCSAELLNDKPINHRGKGRTWRLGAEKNWGVHVCVSGRTRQERERKDVKGGREEKERRGGKDLRRAGEQSMAG